MFNYRYQKHLIHRFSCILPHKTTMLAWPNNSHKHLSKEHRKHGVIDQGKYRKISTKIKWTDREYHVQYNADVTHKDVKIYCDKTNDQNYHFLVHIQSLMEQGG